MLWLTLAAALELGFNPVLNAPYTQLQTEVGAFSLLTIEAAVRTYFEPNDDIRSNYPFQADYGVRIELTYRTLTAGFYHECRHAVRSNLMPRPLHGAPLHEELYIRLETR